LTLSPRLRLVGSEQVGADRSRRSSASNVHRHRHGRRRGDRSEERAEGLRRLTIACAYDRASIAIGASIAARRLHDGGRDGQGNANFSVDAAAETLALTTVGRWQKGTRVNLERSLKMGDELGGHLVSGHVDGLAELSRART
jgi:riboflavin synthase alpha subunit